MFRKRKPISDIPEDQSFVHDVGKEITSTHPLKMMRLTRPVIYFFIAVLCIAGGVIGIRLPYDDVAQQSANIVAGCIFFAGGLVALAIMLLTARVPIVIKEVKSSVIGVWVGIRKNVVYLESEQVYKGKENVIQVNAGNKRITVLINGRDVYFK